LTGVELGTTRKHLATEGEAELSIHWYGHGRNCGPSLPSMGPSRLPTRSISVLLVEISYQGCIRDIHFIGNIFKINFKEDQLSILVRSMLKTYFKYDSSSILFISILQLRLMTS
jgi:hypothetical protein